MTPDDEARIAASLRAMSVMAASLGLGVVVFAVIALFVLTQQTPPPGTAGLNLPFPLPVLGVGLAFVMLGLSFVVKGKILRGASTRGSGAPAALEALLQRFQRATIVAMAQCEGSGFFLIVLVIISGKAHMVWLAGILLPLAGIIIHFPTREKLDQWLAEVQSS